MRRVILLSSVVATGWMFGGFGESGEALAQCVVTTDCASLGYTESSCPNGGLKCPFGDTWSCKEENCDASYLYTCTGANETAGASSCGGKYAECTCKSGYSWNGTSGA